MISLAILTAALLASPAQAAEWSDVRPGAFVGARLTINGRSGGRPTAALTIAPTRTPSRADGIASKRIGEGLALNLAGGAKPTLTLAGIRADTLLGLHRNGEVDSDKKLGVSTGGWVAIGVGLAALAGGAYVVHVLNEADKNSD